MSSNGINKLITFFKICYIFCKLVKFEEYFIFFIAKEGFLITFVTEINK